MKKKSFLQKIFFRTVFRGSGGGKKIPDRFRSVLTPYFFPTFFTVATSHRRDLTREAPHRSGTRVQKCLPLSRTRQVVLFFIIYVCLYQIAKPRLFFRPPVAARIFGHHETHVFFLYFVGSYPVVAEIYSAELIEERFQGLPATVWFQFAFPNGDAVPTRIHEFPQHFPVAFPITFHLAFPELRVRLRYGIIPAPLVTMPEAAVDENAGPVFSQHYIWLTRKIPAVQAVTVTVAPEVFAHQHFRLCILAADARHIVVPLFRCKSVGHLSAVFLKFRLGHIDGRTF